MLTVSIPQKEQVSNGNKEIFEDLEKELGFVPNLYAAYAHHETALGDYLALQNRKSSLTPQEVEAINLVVSQVNHSDYCIAAHSVTGKNQGFSDEQILEIRSGNPTFNLKINALVKFVEDITLNRSNPSDEVLNNLFAVGYNNENLVDILMTIGNNIMNNFMVGATQAVVDFPEYPEIK